MRLIHIESCELLYLQKYSRELHSFPVFNVVDMLAWPYMLELLGCPKISGRRGPSGTWMPNVNAGTVLVILGLLATLGRLPFWPAYSFVFGQSADISKNNVLLLSSDCFTRKTTNNTDLYFQIGTRSYSSEGRVVRASASGAVYLDLIPSWVKPMTLILVFTASLLDA